MCLQIVFYLVTPVTPPFFNGVINSNPLYPFKNKKYMSSVTHVTLVTPKNDDIQNIN